MKSALLFLATWVGLAQPSSKLIPSADGLTVYDSANNITWLADFNLPARSRFGLPVCNVASPQTCVNPSGSVHYDSAVAWIAAMNAANYLGHNTWQLPTTPILDKNCGKTGPNGNSFGFGCTAGAYDALYNALGLKSPATSTAMPPSTTGPFTNIQPYLYWSQTNAGGNAGNATFSFITGWQGANTLPNFLYIWPMIPGKIAGTPPAGGTGLQVNPGGQTVYDPITNITWLANADLPASNAFGLPACKDPTTPAICIASDGAMTYDTAAQYIAAMNSAAYLGQTHWQLPSIDSSCPGYNCGGTRNPLGALFYDQLGFNPGESAVRVPDVPIGGFHNIQPYLYWTCGGATIQSPCSPDPPAPNFEWSYSFGSRLPGPDLLANSLFVSAYFVGSRVAATGPVIAEVANAEGEVPTIAPNTWVEIKGVNLAPAGDSRIWQSADFIAGQMPTQLDHVSATVNGKPSFVYYISPVQINILTPPDAISGPVQIVVTNNGIASAAFTAQAQALSPSFFVFNDNQHVAAVHADGTLLGPSSMSAPGYTFAPAKPGETVLVYANGFGAAATLSPLPAVKIGNATATVQFAGTVSPGLFQFNVVIPANAQDGDQTIAATFNGATTQPGALITIQH